MYKLTVLSPDTEMYMSVHQRDKRCIASYHYIDFGVTVIQATADPAKFTYVASSGNSMERQNQLDIRSIGPGEYYVVPTSCGAKMEQYREEAEAQGKPFQAADYLRHAVLVIHSSKEYRIDQIPFDKLALEEAMELPVIHGQGRKEQDLFGDGSVMLYTRRSGYAGISYVALNTTTDDPIRLELDFSESKNIVSHQQSLCASVVVPPNEAKVIHHIMPREDNKDWTAGWSCRADWISIEEMNSLRAEDVALHVE
jgi:hypothetical protein